MWPGSELQCCKNERGVKQDCIGTPGVKQRPGG